VTRKKTPIRDDDPIIAEVRRARESIARQFNYDLKAILADARKRTEAARRAGRKVASAPTRPLQSTPASTKKAG